MGMPLDYVALKLAKPTCRHCHGRGTAEVSIANHGIMMKKIRYCDCIIRKPQELAVAIKEAQAIAANLARGTSV